MTPIPPVAPPAAAGWQGTAAPDPTRVFGRRVVAWLVDLVLFWAVIIGVYATTAEYVEVGSVPAACDLLEASNPGEVESCFDLRDLGIPELEDRVYVVTDSADATQTLAVLAYFAGFVVMQGLVGASPGKLVLDLRVVQEDGTRAGVGRSLGRTLAWVVDGAPWFFPLVGGIVGLTSAGHRRIGDMVAGTYVIGRADAGRPVQPDRMQPPGGQAAWGTAPPPPSSATPTGTLDPHDLAVGPGGAPPRATSEATLPPPPPQPATWAPRPPAPPLGTGPHDDDLRPPEAVDEDPTSGALEAADIDAPVVEPDPDWSRIPDLSLDPRGDMSDGVDDADDGHAHDPPTGDARAPDLDLDVDTSLADAWVPPESAFDDSAIDERPTDEHVAPPPGTLPEESDVTGPTTPDMAGGAPIHELPPPQWDPRRNTYLQWDPNERRWLEWDVADERWRPIT